MNVPPLASLTYLIPAAAVGCAVYYLYGDYSPESILVSVLYSSIMSGS